MSDSDAGEASLHLHSSGLRPASKAGVPMPGLATVTVADLVKAAAVPGNGQHREPKSASVDQLAALPQTDAGNAEALQLLHGDALRYDCSRRRWLCWDGSRWALDTDGAPQRLALATARQRLKASADIAAADDHKAAAKWALQSEAAYRVRATLEMASILEQFAVEAERWDRDAWSLVCRNGTVDLQRGELGYSSPADLNTLSTEIAYNAVATCPRWLTFIDEITCGDMELADFLQRAIGYSLSGDTREQVIFVLHGGGANGKSILLSILRDLAGEYAANASFDTFTVDPHGGRQIPNDLAGLRAARLVTASEVREDQRLNEARIKALTGNDPVTVRFLFGEYFSFVPAFKVFLAVNHKPQVRETGDAIWRRVRLIPFNAHFGPDTADPLLLPKLRAELPGILAWAIRGCLSWQRHGLGVPESVEAATRDYQEESDPISAFLAEHTEAAPGETVAAAALYARYRDWATASGEKVMTMTALGRRMMDRKSDRVKTRSGWRYVGFRLLSESEA